MKKSVPWWVGIGFWSPLVVAWGRSIGTSDGLFATGTIVVVILSLVRRHELRGGEKPLVGWQALAASLPIGVIYWLLFWNYREDFWFLRLALPTMTIWLLLALFRQDAIRLGWRPLLVALVWAAQPSYGWLMDLDRDGAVSIWTARAAGFGLWNFGGYTLEQVGPSIRMAHGAVRVLTPCTGLPLLASLCQLGVPLLIGLRVSWLRSLIVLGLTVPLALFAGVLRTALLALLVADHERFAYWHGDEGAAIFTSAVLVVLALLVTKVMPDSQEPPGDIAKAADASLGTAVDLPGKGRQVVLGMQIVAGLGVAVALAMGLRGDQSNRLDAFEEPARISGFTFSGETARDDLLRKPPDAENPMTWAREYVYERPQEGSIIRVVVGFADIWFDGNPQVLAWKAGQMKSGPVFPPTTREIPKFGRVVEIENRFDQVRWVTTIRLTGRLVTAEEEWTRQVNGDGSKLTRLAHWFAGQSPWREKRGYWLLVQWNGSNGAAAAELLNAVTAWTQHIQSE